MQLSPITEKPPQQTTQEPETENNVRRHRRTAAIADIADLEAQFPLEEPESHDNAKPRSANGSVSTSPLTWDEPRDSLGSDYQDRVELVKLCDDVIWGELVWEENQAPAADAVMCFVCCPCMVPTTNDPQTQNGQLAPGKIAWQRLCSCSVLFSLLEAILLIVTCVLPPGIAPMELNMWYGPYPHVLSDFGAKNAALILYRDEWWRLLTCTLLHAGVIHYAVNALVLLKLGVFMEMRWGRLKWVIIYVITGCYGSLCSCITLPDSLGVGASGAIMGMFGAWMVDMMLAWESATEQQLPVFKRHMAIVLITTVATILLIFIPAFDSAAHIGGLVSGCALGLVLFAGNVRDRCLSHFIAMAGLFVLCMMVCITLWYLVNFVEPSRALLHYCEVAHKQIADYPSCD